MSLRTPCTIDAAVRRYEGAAVDDCCAVRVHHHASGELRAIAAYCCRMPLDDAG